MATNSNQKSTTGQRRASSQKKDAKNKKKLVLFAIEIIVILVMLAVLYLVMTHTDNEGPKRVVLEEEELAIPEEIQKEKEEGGTMKGYVNVALFGVDATTEDQLYKNSRSDSMMIASINMDTGDIKLVSVYRDTYLNLGTDKYNKCNSAYSYGGAEQAIKMLNMNLDMDITDFVTVGYKGLIKLIDGLGGVYVEVEENEIKHLNSYQITIAGKRTGDYNANGEPNYTAVEGKDYIAVKNAGYQKLNGLQATAYCRIRYVGDDFMRTARQREVIKAIETEAKKADFATLSKIFNDVIGSVYTSFSDEELLELIKNIADYRIVDEGGFPERDTLTVANIGAKGSCIVPTDLTENVVWLHKFLFDDETYTVTDSVKECSEKIKSDTAAYINKIN